MAQTDLVAKSLIGAAGMSMELIDQLKTTILQLKSQGAWPADILDAARDIIKKFEPLLAEHIGDASLAAWIDGFDHVAKQFPPWLQREFETTKRQSPPPPANRVRLFRVFDEEPELRLPIIEQAAERLMERSIMTRSQFDAASAQAKLQAFEIAGGLSEDTIERMRTMLMEDLLEGTSLDGFEKKVEKHLGTSPIGPAHLENVYRTNTQAAFRDGRETLRSNPIVAATFPYQQYIATHDGRTRHNHRAMEKLGLDGTSIYRADDPVWDHFTPPWDYNCRCSVRLLTLEQAAKLGVKEAQRWLKTGRPPLQPEYRLAHIPFESDPDWGSRGRVGPVFMSLVIQRMSQFRAPSGYTRANPLVINGVEYVGGEWIPVDQVEYASAEQKKEIKEGRKEGTEAKPKADLSKFKPTEDQAMLLTMVGRNGRSFPAGQDVFATRHKRSIDALVQRGIVERTEANGTITYKRVVDVTLGAPNTKISGKAPKPPAERSSTANETSAPKTDKTPKTKPPKPKRNPDAGNFHYKSRDFFKTGLKAKFNDNMEAIRTLKLLELEKRPATPEEQDKLSKYVGWGQFKSVFNYDQKTYEEYYKWSKERAAFEELVGSEEFESARASTINAHYTHPDVVAAHWDMAQRLGFKGGKYLDPAVGSGYYVGFMPQKLAENTSTTAIEMDKLTGSIAKQLYPSANVQVSPFQKYKTPDDFYDLVATNVPFSSKVRVRDPKYKSMHPTLHDYYFLRSVDTAKPGGLIMHLTSAGTMDKLDDRVRNHINENAELVAAFRFPGDTHKENAGTSVVTDMLILRKKHPDIPPTTDEVPPEAIPPGNRWADGGERWTQEELNERTRKLRDGEPVDDSPKPNAPGFTGVTVDSLGRLYHWRDGKRVPAPQWNDIVEVPDPDGKAPIPVNRYFAEHPEQILGRLDRTGTMYKGDSMNVSKTDDYEERLQQGIARLPENAFWADKKSKEEKDEPDAPQRIEATRPYAEGSYVIKDGILYQHFNGALEPKSVNAKVFERIKGQIAIRDAARRLIAAQQSGEGIEEARADLNTAYDEYIAKQGILHDKMNRQAMKGDPDGAFLLSLESYNATAKKATKADLFTKNTIRSFTRADKASSTLDATGIVLNEGGNLDIERIASLTGKDRETVEEELVRDGLAFKDPSGEKWTTAADYLSGNTRKKLAEAKAAAASDPYYEVNVAALEKSQPEDIDPEDIGVKPGAPWVPAKYFSDFSAEILGVDPDAVRVKYIAETGEWDVYAQKYLGFRNSNTDVWGIRNDADELVYDYEDVLRSALSGKPLIVRSSVSDENHHHPVLPEQTEAAREKVEELRSRFAEWIWDDEARREELHRYYNDNFNNIVPTHYDGSHLTFPGMIESFKMRDIQKNFVWRVITTGKGLAAHEVGTGKTASMIASAMELRRLGLAKKPAIAVLKSNIEQFTAEAQDLYPGAKILSTADMFDAKKRQKSLNQIATGDYDMIIMTHDHLDAMRMKPETTAKFIREEIEELSDAILAAHAEDIASGAKKQSNRIVGELEARKQDLEEQLSEALKDSTKDDIYFEDSGIDMLFVDEAHNFKSLPCHTRRGQIKGIPSQRSQRATNMLARTRWLLEKNNGRGVVFATGTPIANTMGELFNMQRYLQFDALKERGLHRFDAWADTYGDVVNRIEFKLNGDVAPTSRFAEFQNLPELRHLASEFMDVQRADNLINPDGSPVIVRPKRHDQIVISQENDGIREMMHDIQSRAEALKGKRRNQKGDDNMLSVCNDAKLGSIDMRLINPDAEDHPDSKLNQAVRKIVEVYQSNPGKTQAVFSDLGVHENEYGFSVFADMRKKLIAAGIPANEIVDFSDESMKDTKRDEAQQAAKRGDVRVLFGSTKRLGTGTNIQHKLIAIHHLDIPYVPAHLEQRDGRGYRNGNENTDLQIYKYVQQGSADNLFWQIVANKANFINQYMLGRGARTMKDLETDTLTPDEMMAVATGDETMIERVTLEDEVRKLRRAELRHKSDRAKLEQGVAESGNVLEAMHTKHRDHRSDAADLENREFSVDIDGVRYDTRADAEKALQEKTKKIAPEFDDYRQRTKRVLLGKYKGVLDIYARPGGAVDLVGRSGQTYMSGPSLASIEYAARAIKAKAEESQRDIENYQIDLGKIREQLTQPFRHTQTLREKEARLEELQLARTRRMALTPGITKVFNGVTYVLNEHHRWTLQDEVRPEGRQPQQQQQPAAPAPKPQQNAPAQNRAPAPQAPRTTPPAKPTAPPPAAPAPAAPSATGAKSPPPPTPEVMQLAASDGDTPQHRQAREHVAIHYLSTHATFYNHKTGAMEPLDPPRIKGMFDGIDLSKPVVMGPPPEIPPPETMVQWQAKGGYRGSYFSLPGTKPQDLGIYEHATAWTLPGTPVLPRERTEFVTRNAKFDRMTYLRSTAAPTIDTWSIPNSPQQVAGGGPQWFIPTAAHPAVRVPKKNAPTPASNPNNRAPANAVARPGNGGSAEATQVGSSGT